MPRVLAPSKGNRYDDSVAWGNVDPWALTPDAGARHIMGTIMNPILEKTLDLLRDGRIPKVISPEKTTAPNKKVTFVFEDGSEDLLETEADPGTFMEWWKRTTGYLRQCADAFNSPELGP